MKKKLKKISRKYFMPVVASVAALLFWLHYRDGGYLWWIVLIGVILGANIWVLVGNKANNRRSYKDAETSST